MVAAGFQRFLSLLYLLFLCGKLLRHILHLSIRLLADLCSFKLCLMDPATESLLLLHVLSDRQLCLVRLLLQGHKALAQALVLLGVGNDLPLEHARSAAVLEKVTLVIVFGLRMGLPLGVELLSHLLGHSRVLVADLIRLAPEERPFIVMLGAKILNSLFMLLLQTKLLVAMSLSLVAELQLDIFDIVLDLLKELL